MTILDNYNFKSEPGKDFGAPLLVKIVTEIYPVSFFLVTHGWKERLQDTYTLQNAGNKAYFCRWDTSDYESLVGYQPGGRWPILIWKREMGAFAAGDVKLLGTVASSWFNIPVYYKTFIAICLKLERLPLCTRLNFTEKKVRNHKITISEKVGRAIRRA